MQDALARIDELMRQLIEADQTGSGIEPLEMANELNTIRNSLVQGRDVLPRSGGELHFRCDTCGTIVHGRTAPAICPSCGKSKFFDADIQSPTGHAGPA